MRAIIVAAGLGSRLGHYTDERPKCMVEVDGEPLLHRQLRALRGGGVDEIHIVRGYLGDRIEAPGATFHENPNFRENNILFSLFHAESAMEGPFLVSYSDILYTEEVVRTLVDTAAEMALVVDRGWEEAYEDRTDHPVEQAELAEVRDGRIRRVGKQVAPEPAAGEFIGLAKFGERGGARLREVFGDVRRARAPSEPFHNADELRNAYLTDLFMECIDRGMRLEPAFIDGGWREVDTVEDLHRVSREWPSGTDTPGRNDE